jgi:hypothetical protein
MKFDLLNQAENSRIMKQTTLKKQLFILRICIMTFILVIVSMFLFSFKAKRMADDFLAQLGISKTLADEKIIGSFLGGSLDAYGVKNVKNIAVGNRTAVTMDLLRYTKKFTQGESFAAKYLEMKNNNKPEKPVVQSPEEMRATTIDAYKKSIEQTELSMKNADANMKPIFENVLKEAKKGLAAAEDPNNKSIASYTKGYPAMLKQIEEGYARQLVEWEKKYPSDSRQYIKMRLQEFLDETDDIDFNAELKTQDGKKVFVNRDYENRGNRWKMAFRAGKEVVEPARKFALEWMSEIK